MSMSIVRQSIQVMPNGEVVITEQDMTTGKIRVIPLSVENEKIYAREDMTNACTD